MRTNKINYKGTDVTEIYKLALIGADFATEKNESGITVINSLNKELYAETVLCARFLNIIDIPEDRVMSLDQYRDNYSATERFKGKGIERLKADFDLFASMLDDEIKNCLAIGNDVTNRFNETMAVDMSPEKLEILQKNSKELLTSLKKITKAVEKAENINTKA